MTDGETRTGLERAALVIAALTAFVLACIFLWSGEIAEFKWINHDVANALYIGDRILHGDRLYVDWYYFVMPPVVFLSAAVCLVAETLALSPPSVNHLLVIATAGLGISVLAAAFPDARARRSGLYAVAILAYLGILVRPGPLWPFFRDFGQREHLFALLLVPYCIWRISGAPPGRRVVALALALGYGMMNKPHFIALVGLIELFHLSDRRMLRRLWTALAAGAALPFALLVLDSPESGVALFTRAFSHHLSSGTFNVPWAEFLGSSDNARILGLAAALLGLLVVARWRKCLDLRHALLMGTLVVVAYLTFVQQQKFFQYHLIPFTTLAVVLGAIVTWRLAATVRHRPLRRGLEFAVVAFSLFQIGSGVYGLWSQVKNETRANVAASLPFLEELERARLVLLFSPLVEGRLFAFTFGHDVEIMRPWSSNYTFGELLATPDRAERDRLVRAYYAPIAQRIQDEEPDLVVFSPSSASLPFGTRKLHDAIVTRYKLFPSSEYFRGRRFGNGWIMYRRADGV